MHPLLTLRKKGLVIVSILVVFCVLLGVAVYHATFTTSGPRVANAGQKYTVSPVTATPQAQEEFLPLVQNPGQILGIEGNPNTSYPGISWVRLGYPTCGWGKLTGNALKSTIRTYHSKGIRVLLTVCQGPNDARLYDPRPLNDAAQGGPDAVQCGNEEMKYDPSVAFLYIPPERFARFFGLCEHAMHAVHSNIPVLLGSLDPHVGGIDYQPLLDQVKYLNRMQNAMNAQKVYPGGHWNWHTQTLGLIDSWHNGYPDSSVNSLAGLFSFWSQQFPANLKKGELGRHLWVVEGTGCFKGCGVNPNNSYQVAVSHILSLITDVQTALSYGIPFFYFSGKDFFSVGYKWPIGVLDVNGHPKPLRQDLSMGARTLRLACSSRSVTVSNQEDLLVRMYSRCTLPKGYVGTLMT